MNNYKIFGLCFCAFILITGCINNSKLSPNINKYDLNLINQDATLDPNIPQELKKTFFAVYPKMVRDFNENAPKEIEVLIDTSYEGVAYAHSNKIVISSNWLHKMPKDFDVITHEAMHLVQSYPNGSGPGWLTEGIADYVRAVYGVSNAEGGWFVPDYAENNHYQNSYRITARFLIWATENYDKNLVFKLDKDLRNETYNDSLWKEYTGKTLDELWTAYSGDPTIS